MGEKVASVTDIVLVGRNAETRTLLKGLLRLHRHHIVGEGGTFEQAATFLRTSPPPLLVLDTEGGAEDWSAASQAVAHYPGLKTVVITGGRSPKYEEKAQQAGISRVVHRPFSVHELVDAVASASPNGASPRNPPNA
jgi:DNA-binding NarL/FixJ family response regulator